MFGIILFSILHRLISMKYILFLFTSLSLFALENFITPMEYASQLYKNPRGIGCNHCHGENGRGKLIATYKHKGIQKSFRGPQINTLKYAEFYQALNRRKKAMPRYFLTTKEVEALYLYLHKQEREEKRKKSEK